MWVREREGEQRGARLLIAGPDWLWSGYVRVLVEEIGSGERRGVGTELIPTAEYTY